MADNDTNCLIGVFNIMQLPAEELLNNIRNRRRHGPVTVAATTDTTAPPTTTARPYLISFKDANARRDVLDSARKLAGSELDMVSVRPDLTKQQQEQDRAFRSETTRLNSANPEDDRGRSYFWKNLNRCT